MWCDVIVCACVDYCVYALVVCVCMCYDYVSVFVYGEMSRPINSMITILIFTEFSLCVM